MEARGSKTLLGGEPLREPSWLVWTLMKAGRVVFLTVLWTGLGMGVGLFCGILGLLALGALHHQMPEMSMAYRYISIPVAVCSGSGAFLWNVARALQAAGRKHKSGKLAA